MSQDREKDKNVEKCPAFILTDGSSIETGCSWPRGHLGCHSALVHAEQIKWGGDLGLFAQALSDKEAETIEAAVKVVLDKKILICSCRETGGCPRVNAIVDALRTLHNQAGEAR